jgi:hypothetical protein
MVMYGICCWNVVGFCEFIPSPDQIEPPSIIWKLEMYRSENEATVSWEVVYEGGFISQLRIPQLWKLANLAIQT